MEKYLKVHSTADLLYILQFDEPMAMKRMAVSLGVQERDVLLDHAGLNTALTIRNTEKMFHALRPGRVMVVSHFYHLPRIKMAYARAGREVVQQVRAVGRHPSA